MTETIAALLDVLVERFKIILHK